MSTLMPLAATVLALEGLILIALLFALYRKVCRLDDSTQKIEDAVTAPGHTGLPWTEFEDDENGDLGVQAPPAAEHESLYDMTRYAMCALRFQLEAEQRDRDRADGANVARLRLAFREPDPRRGPDTGAQRKVALVS